MDGDVEMCNKLQAYLEYRSRNVDPPTMYADAWDAFYDFYTPKIRAFLRRSNLAEHDREDCLQTIWSEVVVHLAQLRFDPRRARLSTWLLTVARNRMVDTIRRRNCYPVVQIEDADALVDPGPGPVVACEGRATRDQVRIMLVELSAQVSALNFQVFYQRAIDGRTSAEVASALGLTRKQVKFRLHRMKRKFRSLLDCQASSIRARGGPSSPEA